MGLQDRDYWKERYDERMGANKPQQQGSKDTAKLEKLKFFDEADGSSPEKTKQSSQKSTFMDKFLWVMGFVTGTCLYFGYFRKDFLAWLAN